MLVTDCIWDSACAWCTFYSGSGGFIYYFGDLQFGAGSLCAITVRGLENSPVCSTVYTGTTVLLPVAGAV